MTSNPPSNFVMPSPREYLTYVLGYSMANVEDILAGMDCNEDLPNPDLIIDNEVHPS